MRIRTEQLDALFKQQELLAQKPATAGKQDFGATLAQELGLGQGATGSSTMPLPGANNPVIGQMLLDSTEKTSAGDSDMEIVMQQVMEQASSALDTWDSYVGALGKTGQQGSLREAYGFLQGLDGQVAALKQGAQPVQGKNSGLDSLVQELEVMATTEKFKFNRGDYV